MELTENEKQFFRGLEALCEKHGAMIIGAKDGDDMRIYVGDGKYQARAIGGELYIENVPLPVAIKPDSWRREK